MATVKPFRGLHYNSKIISNLSEVVVPPYDVISPEELQKLKKSNPYNYTNIILEEGEDKYKKAAATLARFQSEKVLERDSKPAFYFYEQAFKLNKRELFCQNVAPGLLKRSTFFGVVDVQDYSDRVILPHEHTFSGPKADRYNLMDATQGHMEPIFLGYDSTKFSNSSELKGRQVFSYEDDAKVHHTLWAVDTPEQTSQVSKEFEKLKLYILDGHHRYETALKYYKDHGKPGSKGVLAAICSLRQESTVILPTHRALKGISKDFMERKSSVLSFQKVDSLENLEGQLKASKKYAFGFWTSAGELFLAESIRDTTSKVLDLDFLHEEVLDKDSQIEYLKDIDLLMTEVKKKVFDLGILVRPCTVDQVMNVAENSGKMPHKSTFFFPKIPSGLLINLFD